jgi:putative oxidoreductase
VPRVGIDHVDWHRLRLEAHNAGGDYRDVGIINRVGRTYLYGQRQSLAGPRKEATMIRTTDLSRYQPYLLAVLRIVAGVLFLSHGLAKLVGYPVAPPGIQPLMSVFGVGSVIETVTGTLIILGLFTHAAAFIAAGEMAFAYWMFHAPQNLFPAANGGDAAILFCFIFLYLVTAGPGAFSLEGVFRSSAAGAAPLAPRSRT